MSTDIPDQSYDEFIKPSHEMVSKRHKIAMAYLVIAIVIGLPIWWFSTSPTQCEISSIAEISAPPVYQLESGQKRHFLLKVVPEFEISIVALIRSQEDLEPLRKIKHQLEQLFSHLKEIRISLTVLHTMKTISIEDINALENLLDTTSQQKPKINLVISMHSETSQDNLVVAQWGILSHRNPNMANLVQAVYTLLGFTPFDISMPLTDQQQNVAKWRLDQSKQASIDTYTAFKALTWLKDSQPFLVIKQEIANKVQQAVRDYREAQDLIISKNKQSPYEPSIRAKVASYWAFFNPSLLDLLYFPEDQKFGIYVPLFAPIGVSVISSVLKAVKFFKTSKKAHNE